MAGIPEKLALQSLEWFSDRRERYWARKVLAAGGRRIMPLAALSKVGADWRRAGLYEPSTLSLFRSVRERTNSARANLEYCSMKRRMGYELDILDLKKLQDVSSSLSDFGQDWVRRVSREFDILGENRVIWEDKIAENVCANQDGWRESFENKIRLLAASGGICVVGNSGSLRGSHLGEKIDSFGLVIRFNCCFGSSVNDLGSNINIWMCSPSYDGPFPDRQQATVISGPEMHWCIRDWSRYAKIIATGMPVLTVPRVVWKEGVYTLGAPPTAGFLFLTWLRRVLGSWRGVTVAGIGTKGATYHQANDSLLPVLSHNFPGEAAEIRRFIVEGLLSL